MGRTYLRLPGVRRLEYLVAFLESHRNNEINEEQAQKAVQQQLHHFELKKAKALGRQRPRTRKGTETTKECLRMASQLGLIDSMMRLRPVASLVLDPTRRRAIMLEKIWVTYPRFKQVVLRTRDYESLDLPFYEWEDISQDTVARVSDLGLNRWTFEIIRDLATQLELLNWYPTENKRQIVYPVAQVATRTELFCLSGQEFDSSTPLQQRLYLIGKQLNLLAIHNGRYEFQPGNYFEDPEYLALQADMDQVFFRTHDISYEEFEQTLWENYLALSGMRAQFPILYPSLRNSVCAKLHISDQTFDRHLLTLVREPQRLVIYPSGGVLNYSANLAHIAKFLPPETSQGNFIVYLKITRRSTI